jgi:RNA polymerase sigma-70 factor (ECF subfamily)
MVAARMDERLSARVDPSDVVQDALTVASERLAEYLRARPIPFYPWLRQIAWNRLVDLHRSHVMTDKRSVAREEPWRVSDASTHRLAERLLARETGPLKRLLKDEMRARVRATLDRLSEDDREILLLRHVEQLNGAESAALLGISEAAAKQRHVRAVRRLRRLLEDELSGEL